MQGMDFLVKWLGGTLITLRVYIADLLFPVLDIRLNQRQALTTLYRNTN